MSTPNTGLFASAETGNEVSKAEFDAQVSDLRVELLNLQYDLKHANFSVLLLVAGDDRPGTIAAVRTLHEWMDARYINTHVLFDDARDSDTEHPLLWRYWRRLPRAGRVGLFVGAWPTMLIRSALIEKWSTAELDGWLDHTERFERALALEGTLVLKFWFHLAKDAHRKRLKEAAKNPELNWQYEARDWQILDNYDRGLELVEHAVRRTNTPRAPWIVIESTDRRYRDLTMGQQVAMALKARLEVGPPVRAEAPVQLSTPGQSVLEQIDLSATAPDSYSDDLNRLQARLNELGRVASENGISCAMVFEGVDAAGKGGAIRRLTTALPIQSTRVVSIAAPDEEERAHHYLWRFWREVPARGETVIFDRSWYGRVLVERVEELANERQWSRAYEEINDFESSLNDFGIVVTKFWLQIDADEQLARFNARAETPYKKYKLTDEDYRNREKWADYQQAAHEMIARTNTHYAPWHLVASNDKKHARLQVLETVCDRLESRLVDAFGKSWKKKLTPRTDKSSNDKAKKNKKKS